MLSAHTKQMCPSPFALYGDDSFLWADSYLDEAEYEEL
jgi:hypothetical protein